MSEPQSERHIASHIFNIVMMVFGASALAWMMHRLGWARFREVVDNVGWYFAVILGLDVSAVLLDARALHTFMRPEARMVSYWRVFAAQISGRAINVVTPFGALGEATKLTMLISHVPRARVLSAIVLLNLSALYLSVAVMVIGAPITLLLVDLPSSLKITVGIGLAVLIPLMIALGVVVQRGALSTLTGMLHGVRLISAARRDAWRGRLQEVDRHIGELHSHRSAGTWKGIFWVVAARLVTWLATMMLIRAVGVAITPHLVIGVLSVGVLIQWIASIVPLGLGLADGGNYALYGLLGASGANGTFVTMLNRVRSLGVAMVGFVAMAVLHISNRLETMRLRRKLRDHKAGLAARVDSVA
ncbi:MAG: flippase-like domain-containing protein [Myxococcales bacterium]|nr:flippase-like domain-containing protein [Myxococcales bacterium]